MKKIDRFIYPGTKREQIKGKRHYSVGEEKLPSVTTILAATQSEEKKASLARWKAREGEARAEEIKNLSANRGTLMHNLLEKHILGIGYQDLTDLGQEATKMAAMIVDRGLSKVSGYYGTEVTVHYPGLYAGQTDLAGVFDGQDAIIDFKQSNKAKQREWIGDYFTQLAAYAMAHDHVYGTQIDKCVIMMCTPEPFYQEFILQGEELKKYKYEWLKKIDQYYKGGV